jgi:hypothetical protein
MFRPITTAPMLSHHPRTTSLLAFVSPAVGSRASPEHVEWAPRGQVDAAYAADSSAVGKR